GVRRSVTARLLSIVARRWSSSRCLLSVCLHGLTHRRKNTVADFIVVEIDPIQPTDKFGPAPGNNQPYAGRLQFYAEIAQRGQPAEIDVTDRNCIDHEPLQVRPSGLDRRKRPLLEVVGIEESQWPIEAKECETRERGRCRMSFNR